MYVLEDMRFVIFYRWPSIVFCISFVSVSVTQICEWCVCACVCACGRVTCNRKGLSLLESPDIEECMHQDVAKPLGEILGDLYGQNIKGLIKLHDL